MRVRMEGAGRRYWKFREKEGRKQLSCRMGAWMDQGNRA